MDKKLISVVSLIFLSAPAWAADGGTEAEYLWTKETNVRSLVRVDMGVGLLGASNPVTGARGTPITNFFGVDFAVTPDFQVSLGLPLAGTLSSGPDDYGIGNVVLEGKYVVPLDRFRVALGLEAALPSARVGATVGTATRQDIYYLKDQTAISPFVALSYVGERLQFTLDLENNLQIFNNTSPGLDKMEDQIAYDAAVAHSFYENMWLTVEFGGYSQLTYGANETELFAGPGIRYQDHELSAGFHFLAPFRQPARSTIAFMGVFDLRVAF